MVKIAGIPPSHRLPMRHPALIALLLPFALCRADETLSVTSGIDYSSGRYGNRIRTETLTIPLGLKYESGSWTARASIPYIDSTGPADVVGRGDDRISLGNSGQGRKRVGGQGDMTISLSRALYEENAWLLEVGAKVKLATGDKDKGLGTGKNDYALQGEIYRVIGKHTLFAILGAKKMGDPDGIDLRDPLYGSLGWSTRAAGNISLGFSYDYRQKLQASSDPVRESTVFLTYRMDPRWKFQSYVVYGFSRASPDLGGGLMLIHSP